MRGERRMRRAREMRGIRRRARSPHEDGRRAMRAFMGVGRWRAADGETSATACVAAAPRGIFPQTNPPAHPNPSDEASAPPRRSRIGGFVRRGRAASDDDASRARRGIARAAAHPPRAGASGCSRHGWGCEHAGDRISRKRARRDVLGRIGGFGDRVRGGCGGDREDVAGAASRRPARSRADGHGAVAGGCAVRSVPACGRGSVCIFLRGGAAERFASIARRVVCLLRASGSRANGLRVKEDGRNDAA
jgi:hypothetical protein